jgi:hypothetical protein
MNKSCRSIESFSDVFRESPSPSIKFPWESVCEAAFCMTTKSLLRERGGHLRTALLESGLSDFAKIVVNDGPFTKECRKCSIVRANKESHTFVYDHARQLGFKTILVLEDDFYFDVKALLESFSSISSFLRRKYDFSVLLLGGVYLDMQKTEIPKVFHGKGVQAHAWIVNLSHPLWSDGRSLQKYDMVDICNNRHGDTYMLYPDIAFQKSFCRKGAYASRPVYPLKQFPVLYRVLTWVGLKLGMRNCWEGCARKTNFLIRYLGSLEVLVIVVVLVALCFAVTCGKMCRALFTT